MPFVTRVLFGVSVTVFISAGLAVSQTVAGVASGQMSFASAGPRMQAVVTGLPYSAEQVTEQVQTLANGTHITSTAQTSLMYRDSAGRTRIEHSFAKPPGVVTAFNAPSFIQIDDPVTGEHYTLDTVHKVAHRMVLFTTSPMRVSTGPVLGPSIAFAAPVPNITLSSTAATTPAGSHPESSRESLGTQTIEGVMAEGTRITTTYPVGFVGNDQPISVVSETWRSPDLGLVLLAKTSDPRSGETTTKLTNLSRSEPDPALFQVPSDYTIEEPPQPTVVPK